MTGRTSLDRAGAWCGLIVGAACAVLTASGCNRGDGIPRYRVSGSVSFDGRAVPAGMVYFNPDTTAGNDGPAGFAPIVAGHYDTAAKGGRPAIAGPHQVVIEGHEPMSAAASGDVQGRPLFGGYRIPLDLPAAASQHDFAVPADAAKVLAQ
jgi:hypothetical protein